VGVVGGFPQPSESCWNAQYMKVDHASFLLDLLKVAVP